jgi:galactonate dehydratase
VCLVGGISGAKKTAALAEARYVGMVPYNPLSPLSTAACLQIAARIPNFALQEYPSGEDRPPKSDMVTGIPQHDGKGFLRIPDSLGLGVALKPSAVEKCPMKPRAAVTRLHVDGAALDQ